MKKKNNFGKISIWCGIGSLVLWAPLGILAIIYGIMALNKKQKYGLEGLIAGIAGMLYYILLLAGVTLF